MADRINIGAGPRIKYGNSTGTSGFRYTDQETLSKDQYGSQFVNFYTQSLDASSLAADTGVEPDAPAVGEDIKLKGMTSDDSDGVVSDALSMGTILGQDNVVGGESVAPEFGAASFGVNFSNFNSYTDYLASVGMKDRINADMFKGFYEPIAKGEYSNLDFGVLGKQTTEKVTGLPGEIQADLDALKNDPANKISKGAPKAISGVASMLNPMMGLAMGVFTGAGATVRNAFGEKSFRPSGVPGVVADMVHAKQFQAIKNIQAAQAAYDALPASEQTSLSRGDSGFSMKMGNFGVVRDIGDRNYTGNMRGLSHVQMKELEALSKGIIPKTFRMDGGDTDIFGGRANQSIVASGGVMMSKNPMDGYITADGRVSVPGMGGVTAGTAYMSQIESIASKENLSVEQVIAAKDAAQAGNGTFGSNIRDQQRVNEAAARQPEGIITADNAAEKAAEDAAKKAEDAAFRAKVDVFNEARTGSSRSDGGYDTETVTSSPPPSGGTGGYDEAPVTSSPFGGNESDTGPKDDAPDPSDSTNDDGFDDGGAYSGMAQGGRVGMAAGGQMAAGMAPSGFIGAPPSQVSEAESVADNVNTQKEEGTFIINAAAVEFAGESDIVKMLKDAQKEAVRRGIVVDNPESSAKLIDVALSQGEVTVAPHLVKIIGEDRLTKINNRGKPETQERIQENGQQVMGAAEGGFLGFIDSINPFSSSEEEAPQQGFATVRVKPTGPQPVQAGTEYEGDIGDSIPETASQAPLDFVSKLEQHYKKPVTRTQNKKLYNKMTDEQLLAHMIMAETKSSTDPEEAMYAVGQTAIHRRNSNEPEFKKQRSLRDVLLKRLPKGAFEYVGMDVKRNKGLKENFTTNRANYEKGLARATTVAQDLLGGEMESDPAVSSDVMWYTRKDAPNQWMRNNLTLVQTIGEHEFYKAPD